MPATIVSLPPTEPPTATATITPTPVPDFSRIGLPTEAAGTQVFDFVSQACSAQWFTDLGDLPCPGNTSQSETGYVMKLAGDMQDLPKDLNLLLSFPPTTQVETISSKYPAFTVEKGDRFRAVLTCLSHTFCDVQFILDYFDKQGHTGLKHWRYLFADTPIVVDYPLDGIAGKTVQFDLAVQAMGNRIDANAVWIAPHIYRPGTSW